MTTATNELEFEKEMGGKAKKVPGEGKHNIRCLSLLRAEMKAVGKGNDGAGGCTPTTNYFPP